MPMDGSALPSLRVRRATASGRVGLIRQLFDKITRHQRRWGQPASEE